MQEVVFACGVEGIKRLIKKEKEMRRAEDRKERELVGGAYAAGNIDNEAYKQGLAALAVVGEVEMEENDKGGETLPVRWAKKKIRMPVIVKDKDNDKIKEQPAQGSQIRVGGAKRKERAHDAHAYGGLRSVIGMVSNWCRSFYFFAEVFRLV